MLWRGGLAPQSSLFKPYLKDNTGLCFVLEKGEVNWKTMANTCHLQARFTASPQSHSPASKVQNDRAAQNKRVISPCSKVFMTGGGLDLSSTFEPSLFLWLAVRGTEGARALMGSLQGLLFVISSPKPFKLFCMLVFNQCWGLSLAVKGTYHVSHPLRRATGMCAREARI